MSHDPTKGSYNASLRNSKFCSFDRPTQLQLTEYNVQYVFNILETFRYGLDYGMVLVSTYTSATRESCAQQTLITTVLHVAQHKGLQIRDAGYSHSPRQLLFHHDVFLCFIAAEGIGTFVCGAHA